MTSLLRLIGDSNKNNSEVRNTFKEPLIIKENSKIALVGMNAMLESDVATDVSFIIDSLNDQFQFGVSAVDDATIYSNITQGTFNRNEFIKEFGIAMNYPVVTVDSIEILNNEDKCLGLDNSIAIVNGKVEITTRKAKLDAPDINGGLTDGHWISLEVAPATTTTDGFTATATPASETVLVSGGGIPYVSSSIQATFVNAEAVDMGLYVVDFYSGEIYWGLHVVDGAYYLKTPTDDIEVLEGTEPVLATDGDIVELWQFGGSIIIRIAGNVYPTYTGIVPRTVFDRSLNGLTWQLNAETDGQISDITLTELEGIAPPLTMVGDEEDVVAFIQFRDITGVSCKLLSGYLGFPGDFDKIVYRPKVQNSPSILVSPVEPVGVPTISSIIITIEGIGILRSVDGSGDSKAPSNIVYAIHKLKDVGQFLQLDIPQPIYLNLNNRNPVNVNELRVRMLEASGYNTLKFLGKPSFTFVISD